MSLRVMYGGGQSVVLGNEYGRDNEKDKINLNNL